MSKKSNLALGTILVAGAGYIAGILTAPKSGRQTRKDIRTAARKAKVEAERNLKRANRELGQLLDEVGAKAKTVGGKAAEELNKVKDQAEKVRQKSREILSAIHEGEADDDELQRVVNDVKQAVKHLKSYLGKTATSQTKK
jgi:gas vesicle protein